MSQRSKESGASFEAVGKGFEETGKDVLGYIFKRVKNHELAQDILSETFEAALRTGFGFDPDKGDMNGWLLSIANRKIIDNYRRSLRKPAVSLELFHDHIDLSCDPIEDLPDRAELQKLKSAVYSLPIEQREVIGLRFEHELSMDRIASIKNIPPGTVRSRSKLALGKLKRALAPKSPTNQER